MPRNCGTTAGSPGVLQYNGGVRKMLSQTSASVEVVALVAEWAAWASDREPDINCP